MLRSHRGDRGSIPLESTALCAARRQANSAAAWRAFCGSSLMGERPKHPFQASPGDGPIETGYPHPRGRYRFESDLLHASRPAHLRAGRCRLRSAVTVPASGGDRGPRDRSREVIARPGLRASRLGVLGRGPRLRGNGERGGERRRRRDARWGAALARAVPDGAILVEVRAQFLMRMRYLHGTYRAVHIARDAHARC